MAKRKEEIPEPSEDEADVMEFFESEDDALFAKELLEQYKRENGGTDGSEYDNYNVPATTRGGGGGGMPMDAMDDMYGARLTPRQVDTRFLLETKDDIPKDIKVSHWLLGSHHNELLNIQDLRQYAKYARENRDVVRTTGWQREHRKTAYSDVVQIEHYSNRLLTKSWKHGERLLQSTVIQRSQNEDVGERAPDADGGNASNVAGGLMGRLGKIFGR
jgi:hypothetical protein